MEDARMTFAQLHDKVCRLCLEEKPQLADLEGLYFDELSFSELIKDCFAVDINVAQRNLPLAICKKCIVATLNFHALKTSVIENEVFLQTMATSPLRKWSDNAETRAPPTPTTPMDHCADLADERCSATSSGVSSQSEVASQKSLCALCEAHSSKHPPPPSQDTSAAEGCKAYECNACEMRFCKASEWKAHMISHYSASKYACVKCTETFPSKHELVAHNYTHLYKAPAQKSPNV